MVIVLLFILFLPASVNAITSDELRALSDVWEAGERERSERIETKNLNKLIPKAPKSKALEKTIVEEKPEKDMPIVQEVLQEKVLQNEVRKKTPDKPKSKKYQLDAGQASHQEDHPFIPSFEAEASPSPGLLPSRMFQQNTDGKYFPPPRQGGFGAITDAVSPDKARMFGIQIGKWIKGELKRPATNAEPGLIEIYTTENVRGKKRTLPSGTIFFAQKAYNVGTKKLDFIVEKGITPQGLEFEIKGLVFDLQRTAGLMGTVTTDSNMIVERSTSKGLVAAGGEMVNQLGGGTIIGAAGSAAAESLLSDSADAVHERQRLKQTIRSAPQHLIIRVEETF